MKVGFDISQAGQQSAGCGVLAKNYAFRLVNHIVGHMKASKLDHLTLYGTLDPIFVIKL